MKNDKGEIISGIRQLKIPEYGTGKNNRFGQPIVNWNYLSKYADDDGFDIRNIESNGKHTIEYILPYGSRIIRYGSEIGHFSSPKGTAYEELSLPYIPESMEYNEYKVIADNVRIVCVVDKGIVAPGFDSLGGAVQYLHPITIREAVKKGMLERI